MPRSFEAGSQRNAVWPVAALALLALFLSAAPAFADTVVLKNGRRLEGRVVVDGDNVTVHTRFGSIKLTRSQIQSIEASRTALDELQERAAALQERIQKEKPGAAAQGQLWYGLAQWCGENQLDRAREENLHRAIAADPEQALARQALGFVKVNGTWVSGNERQQALGLVRYKDQWVTPEARDDAERAAIAARQSDAERSKQDAEIRLKQAEAAKLAAERKLLETQAETGKIERQRLDAEWDQLEKERARLYEPRWSTYYPLYYHPWLGNGPAKPAPVITPAQPKPVPYQPNSGLNNGVSGPGFPLLK